MRIRIFQPIVPEYRVALFNGVGKRYGADVEVWASEGEGEDRSHLLESMRFDYAHPFVKCGPIRWQRGLSLRGLARRDVIVICGDVHQLSSLWIALEARICGIGVVWWGHHMTATSKPLGVKIRLTMAKLLSDVFLCYTRTGVAYLESYGFKKGRVFATGNTIDQVPIRNAIETTRTLPRPFTFTSQYFLCCGVLREKIHLDLFLRAMADSRLKNVGLVVIGEGPMKKAWQELSVELGVSSRIRWVRGTRDQKDMAPWFLGAKALMYPGSIGLTILHSFSYGLPVITHGNAAHQMPEFEAMEDGKTGFCYAEGDAEDLVAKTDMLLSDEKRRTEMARYCLMVAHEKYSMTQMIENYCAAIEAAKADDA